MGGFVGILLIVLAFGTVVAVLYFVMKEQHEHEEHYIPPRKTDAPKTEAGAALGQATSIEAGPVVAEGVHEGATVTDEKPGDARD